MKLRAFVVDDEAPARRRLVRLLEQVRDVEVVAVTGDAEGASAQIAELRPDIVFLDVQMPGMDGLALAQRCAAPAVVFVTAHAEHAVRAFELASVDYLLKPVRLERLEEAVHRARARAEQRAPEPRIVAHDRGSTLFVDPRTVTRFHASDKYTAFASEGRELLTEESLSALEQRLAPFGFVRVHRSELVRLSAIRAFRAEDGAHAVRLDDGQVVPVSRRMATALRERLGI